MSISNFLRTVLFALACLAAFAQPGFAQANDKIRLNQAGFIPSGPKKAIVVGGNAQDFNLLQSPAGTVAFTGKLTAGNLWGPSGETVQIADFSAFKTPGSYQIEVAGMGKSGVFVIDSSLYRQIFLGLSKYYYYNRVSYALTNTYAGKWARALGHPDDLVEVHASAATPGRPTGFHLNASGGWYDAGDYNKYIGPTAVTAAQLLNLFEDVEDYLRQSEWDIPESGNALPDILDESLVGLRFLMRCQDPDDGGFYHKITSATFDAFEMPAADKSARYAVQKSVTGTLAAAAVLAKASRVFKAFETQVPGFTDSALAAAKKGWAWGLANPTKTYSQTAMNSAFTPEIVTGEYGDGNATDEKYWAGVELTLATGDGAFFQAVNPSDTLSGKFNVPNWGTVNSYGLFSLASVASKGGVLPNSIPAKHVQDHVLDIAKVYLQRASTSAIGVGLANGDFAWGSNGDIASQGMVLIMAYRISQDKAYYDAAVAWLDYLLGRNGTGYSYVTGLGWNPPMFPHHRASGADGLADPVPGMVVGGPNNGKQDSKDGCTYPAGSSYAKAYSDAQPCYASNEVTIYWNAPAVYLSGVLAALAEKPSTPIRTPPRSRLKKSRLQSPKRPGLGIHWMWPEAVNALGRITPTP